MPSSFQVVTKSCFGKKNSHLHFIMESLIREESSLIQHWKITRSKKAERDVFFIEIPIPALPALIDLPEENRISSHLSLDQFLVMIQKN